MKKYTPPKIEFVKVEDETSVGMVVTKPNKTFSDALESSSSACFPDSLSSSANDWAVLQPNLKETLLAEDNSQIDWAMS